MSYEPGHSTKNIYLVFSAVPFIGLILFILGQIFLIPNSDFIRFEGKNYSGLDKLIWVYDWTNIFLALVAVLWFSSSFYFYKNICKNRVLFYFFLFVNTLAFVFILFFVVLPYLVLNL